MGGLPKHTRRVLGALDMLSAITAGYGIVALIPEQMLPIWACVFLIVTGVLLHVLVSALLVRFTNAPGPNENRIDTSVF
jgi:membrane protein YdbS with pleckstrin-like domain